MNNIRTKNISGTTYYAAKDLLQLFAVSNYTLKRYVPQEDKLITSMPTTSGTQDLLAISPSGVLALAKKSSLGTDKVNRILQLLNIDIIQDKEDVSNNLIPFENPSFGTIRTLLISGDPWFVGKDVAEVLGYTNPQKAIRDFVEGDDKGVNKTFTPGGPQEVVIINEYGLYSLILSSKLPTAKAFKHWITHDVIPSIRKTGGYVSNADLFVDTYLPFADEATKDLFRANLKVIDDQNKKIKEQNQLIDTQKTEIDYQKEVIRGLTNDLPVPEMRQLINRIIRKGKHFGQRWTLLYKEVKYMHHINIPHRFNNYNENHPDNKYETMLDFADKELHAIPQIFETCLKIYASDARDIVDYYYKLRSVA